MKTSAPEISIFAAFSRHVLPTPNSFSMATIDLNHVQFWAPPPKPLLRKQGTASSLLHSMSKSLRTTNSRNQPIPLHNKADQVFKRNDRSTPAIAAAQRQGDDSSAAEAQGKIKENARNEPV